MREQLAALAAMTLVTSAACAAPLVHPGDRIAIFGDSISSGKGYGFQAVERMNKARPDLQLVGFDHGHPGWRADHATNAIDKVLADNPTLVTIMFGTNDLGQEGARGVATLSERLRRLVERFQAAGIRVVLLTPPYTSPDSRWGASLNAAGLPRMGRQVFDLGAERAVPVFDMFGAMQRAHEEGRGADPAFAMFSAPGDCHPNKDGHAIMAQSLAEFLLTGQAPPYAPFAPAYTGAPRAAAARVARPVDVAAVDAAWPAVAPMVLDQDAQIGETGRWKGAADLSASAQAAWDDTALYLRVAVIDDVVLPGDQQPAWGHDGIEFFFDTRAAAQRDVAYAPGYFQMLVAVAPADGLAPVACGSMDVFDAGAVKATSRRTAEGYVLQIAIPWKALRFTPSAGADLGLDFAINDRDDPKVGRYKALWRGAGDDYTNAGGTGSLRLE